MNQPACFLLIAATLLAGTPAQAEDTVVRIGLAVPNQAFYTAVYVARDLGYYKAEGISTQITEYNGGSAMQEAMSAGAADLTTYHPGGVALAVEKGAREKIVGAITPGSSGWYLIVNAGSPFQKLADLNGKKIGISTPGAATDLFAHWAAERAGISIQTIPVGGGGLIPSLKNNAVDAVVVFQPLSFQLLAAGARPLFDFAKEMPPSLVESWVATHDMIDQHPDIIRKTLGAFYKAVNYMRTHKTEAIGYLKKYTKQEDPKVLDLVFENATMQESTDGLIEEQWIKEGLSIQAKGLNLPELATVKPTGIYTDKFFPFKYN
jgi:NitT/TauT family transport system substrate-binding protein